LQSNAERATVNLYTDWLKTARSKQLAPKEEHHIWMILAGRGWGKTRTGAQDLALYALRNPNTICAVVAPTHGDLRRVCFDGNSGLLSVIPEDCFSQEKSGYSSYRGEEIALFNGSKIIGYAAINPERLRGPQFHRAWCDELASWRYPEAFDQLMFALRLGDSPQCVITTTPRPTKLIKELVDRDDVVVTKGNTFENEENLAETALEMLKRRYEGTTLGRQELYAEIVDEVEGALWSMRLIEENRVAEEPESFRRIVVAIDPAVTSNENSDETGIIVAGVDNKNNYYILDDVSGNMSPDAWAKKAVQCYYNWEASRVVAEVNNGGDLVERIIRQVDANIPYTAVRASRGKMVRAEPIAALSERHLLKFVGSFPELEDQMCSYTGDRKQSSPDRLDAMVWAMTELSRSTGQAQWRIT